MKRRDFSLQLATAGLGTLWAASAGAQGGPVEGTHYTKLAQPVAVSTPAGKIEALKSSLKYPRHKHRNSSRY